MKLIKKISQHRRDFTGLLECEFCKKQEHLSSGYDDSNYYNNVIPNFKCKSCNKSTISENGIIDKISPDVPSHVII
jgi:hypothetical protein